ncbi:MAG: hypothetical protein ACE5HN_01600 [Nitrospiria bacterium]
MLHSSCLTVDETEVSAFTKLTEIVRDKIDLLDIASRLGVAPSTIGKIIEGRPVSRYIEVKIQSALRCDPLLCAAPARPSVIERMVEVNRLYKESGSLKAVGERVGLSRERVRQLLTKGAEVGLFEYRPSKQPFIPKEKILNDYRKYLKLSLVSKVNHISLPYLQQLREVYQITGKELAAVRAVCWRRQCIDAYISIVRALGHHPTTTELQKMKKGRYLQAKIRKLWGSFGAFRKTLDIPPPYRRSVLLRISCAAPPRRVLRTQEKRTEILRQVVGLSHR